MAENKRVYTITISGLTESYEGVKSLREALSGLTDTVINVSNEEKKTSETRKSTASSTDALAKAQEKLNSYDRAYQEELAKVNAELSANKKEINDALKLQQAQDVVDAKQLDTYAQKQQYLSALNTLIRNHSTATEEDTQAIDRMVQESAQLQAELKATDEQMQIYVRNVGNYQGAADTMIESHKGIKQELKDIKTEMAEMLANGVSKTDEGYLKLAERAGQLKDAIGDANADIKNFASDTQGMTNAINLASSAVNAYQLYNSTMELFGAGNEEAAESMKKMMAVMTVLNSLQQVQNSLLENGSATARLYNKAVELIQAALGLKKTAVEADTAATEANAAANEANVVSQEANAAANEASAVAEGVETAAKEANTVATGTNSGALGTNTGALGANAAANQAAATATNTMSVAQKAGAVASNILSVALRAIPLMAIIGLVMTLIQNWESIWNWFKKTFPVLDTLSKKIKNFGGFMNSLITAVKATAYAIRDYLISAITSLGTALSKLFSGDFSGAADALKNIFKDAGKSASNAFNSELSKGFQRGAEERERTAAKEAEEELKHHTNMITDKTNKDGTYTKKYIKAKREELANAVKMYKEGTAEHHRALEAQAQFEQEIQDKKTKAAEAGAKARVKIANKAAKDAQKAAEEAQKEYEELSKAVTKDIEDLDKLSEATTKKSYKQRDELAKEEQKKLSKRASELAELWRDVATFYDSVSKKATEVRKLIAEAEVDGVESEVELLKKYERQLNISLTTFAASMEGVGNNYQQFIDRIFTIAMRRQENAVNDAAISAKELKKQYDKQIEDAEKNLAKLKANSKATAEQISDAQRALDDAQKALELELGQYKDNLDFYIPIDFDIDNLKKRFKEIKPTDFNLGEVINVISGVDGALEKLYKRAEEKDRVFETFRDLGLVLGMAKGDLENMVYDVNDYSEKLQEFLEAATSPVTNDQEFDKKIGHMQDILSEGTINIQKFGLFAKTASDNVKGVFNDTVNAFNSVFSAAVAQQDKIIKFNEKAIQRYRDAVKGLKIEPVMTDDVLSGVFKGQIIDLEETKKRYVSLIDGYKAYQKTLEKGSKERQAYEDAWQKKIDITMRQRDMLGVLYGKESEEYKNAHMEYVLLCEDKKAADKAYALEHEKVTKQIEDAEKKQADLMYDYIKSITDRIADITKTIQENVMNPIFDGLSDLFAFQLEEAEDALDEITELYDKAVEAREKSADRMKEINEELRADDGQNKEELQQRLAEEEVLLVQREEAERALEKEKKKREYEVKVAEAKQRKFELGQKLIEGLVNTALGVTSALKYGPILGPIFAAIIGAMGALQTAIIAKQIGKVKMPEKYAAGGKVGEDGVSRSHKQGGHRIEDTNIEVEGGEWVINKASSKKYDSLLKSINDDNVRLVRKQIEIIKEKRIVERPNRIALMADGGQINTLAATRAVKENNEIAAISELIKQIDFQPTVSVVDINKVNKKLVRVQDYAGKAV